MSRTRADASCSQNLGKDSSPQGCLKGTLTSAEVCILLCGAAGELPATCAAPVDEPIARPRMRLSISGRSSIEQNRTIELPTAPVCRSDRSSS